MTEVEAVLLLLAVTTALVALARRIDVPYPVLLVLGGLAIGLTPGIPHVELEPELVFVLILPPILQAAAFFTPVQSFKAHIRPILSLAVGLVLVSTVAVAAVGHYLVGLDWASAFVLGAIVAPPDAVAATSVAERLGLPARVTSILEGESLVNDATALIAYRVAVAAAVTGHFSMGEAMWDFAKSSAGGVAVGLAVGFGTIWLLGQVEDVGVFTATTVLAAYTGYLAAEELLHASGVLAVVTGGLIMGRGWLRLPNAAAASARLQSRAFWQMLLFLLNGMVFILIGAQLPTVIDGIEATEGVGWATLVWYATAVVVAAVAVRFAWVFLTSDPRLLSPRVRKATSCFEVPVRPASAVGFVPRAFAFAGGRAAGAPQPVDRRELGIISWAGMRGVISLAAALALPPDLPGRDLILYLTFAVILATLVLQGLSLGPLIRWLGVEDDGERDRVELEARAAMAAAARRRLDELAPEGWLHDHVVEDMALHLDAQVRRLDGRRSDRPDDAEAEELAVMLIRLKAELIAARSAEAARLRDRGVIDDGVLRELERDLDRERVGLERV